MPAASEADIRKLIANKTITAITLDTNILHQRGFALEHGHLRLMAQFSRGDYKFILSDIIEQEVRKHMLDAAEGSKNDLTDAMKATCTAWNIPRERREEIVDLVLNDADPAKVVEDRIAAYEKNTGFVRAVSHELLDPVSVLRMYQNIEAPFEKGKKKSKREEFPDAMALLTLEAYAEREKTQVLCITNDGGWFEYAKTSKNLFCFKDIGQALSYFPQHDEHLAAELARRLEAGELPDLLAEMESEVAKYFEGAEIDIQASSSYYYEEYVNDQSLNGMTFDFGSAILVDSDYTELSVEITGTAKVAISVDFSFSMVDSIDKDEISLGSEEAKVEEDKDFKVVLSLAKTAVQHHAEDCVVEVGHFDTTFEFDGIEPSFGWREDEE